MNKGNFVYSKEYSIYTTFGIVVGDYNIQQGSCTVNWCNTSITDTKIELLVRADKCYTIQMLKSYYYQISRHLKIESIGGQLDGYKR